MIKPKKRVKVVDILVSITLWRMSLRVYWLDKKADIEDWCRRCDECLPVKGIPPNLMRKCNSVMYEHLSRKLLLVLQQVLSLEADQEIVTY